MRLNEQRTYTMYLSVSEFELIQPLAETIPFGYCYYHGNVRDEDGEYIVRLEDDMMDDLIEALKEMVSNLRYEECNRTAALEIQYLLNDIYYELNY